MPAEAAQAEKLVSLGFFQEEVAWDSTPHPAQGRVGEKSRAAGEAQPREPGFSCPSGFGTAPLLEPHVCLPRSVFNLISLLCHGLCQCGLGRGFEQALGCCGFLRGDEEGLVCLLAKSLAGSRLGKAAAAWLGLGITPGLLLCLMSHLISHVPHGRWGLFRIN